MSGRLDQSLDSIIDSQKKAKKEQQRRRRGAVKVKAPIGGVKKSTKPAKPAVKAAAATSQPTSSKIVVSGLPYDVNEAQIKEYFNKTVGNVKKVSMQYNQNGASRGIADIIFSKPGLAAKAGKELNGMLVDKRPMKIEVVVDANRVPEPQAPKSLQDRITANSKNQPKSATATKNNAKSNAKGPKGAKDKKPRTQKPKRKTAEELDTEMNDYWGSTNNAGTATGATDAAAAANGAAQPAATGEDLGMDEIS